LKVIAATVASDPAKFNEVFLGKPNEAYCAWILDPEKWGGELQACNTIDFYSSIRPENILSSKCSSVMRTGFPMPVLRVFLLQKMT
jgi:ubiquitin thioesterase OTU1